MSEKPGWGKTVLGWFVVQDGQGGPEGSAGSMPADAADALIAKYASADAAPPPVILNGPLPVIPDGSSDFTAVYEQAGVDAEERDRVKKAQDLLKSLPAETPTAVKRQIVEASLKAFGIPTEKIIEAGVGEIEALESFIRAGQADAQKILSEGSERITALEAEIASVRQIMQGAVTDQESRTRTANAAKLTVQEVLEFFGRDAVAKVVEQSPKLHVPS